MLKYGVNFEPQKTRLILASFTSALSSAALAVRKNSNVRVCVTGQAVWIKEGTADSVTATAGGASCKLCPIGITDFQVAATTTHIAYIEDAMSARGHIETF